MVGLYPRMHLKRTVTGNKRKYKKWLPLERKGGERERNCSPSFLAGGRWAHHRICEIFPDQGSNLSPCTGSAES